MVFRYSGTKLTGINDLKNKHMDQNSVIIGCSGTTFADFKDIAPDDIPRIAVNEAIRKMQNASYWVLSDIEIVIRYAEFCPSQTTILAMRDATKIIKKYCTENRIYTVDSMREAKKYDNGYQFFSRGTVLIGAIEMARWMGFNKMFVFGLDCYRTKDSYYYDGRKPANASEHKCIPKEYVKNSPPSHGMWVTSRLRKMINKLHDVDSAGIWSEIDVYCVGSPYSQQETIPKLSLSEFKGMIEDCERENAPEDCRSGDYLQGRSTSEGREMLSDQVAGDCQ